MSVQMRYKYAAIPISENLRSPTPADHLSGFPDTATIYEPKFLFRNSAFPDYE
jgi:hypothetical protein